MEEIITINKKKIKLSNLDKVYWPEQKITKGDLINYYRSVSEYIIPYLKNRPESLNGIPTELKVKVFFKKMSKICRRTG